MRVGIPLMVAIAVSSGCGGTARSGHVELTGKPASEGSSLAADAICNRDTACGTVDIQCAGGTNMGTTCSATIVHPDQAACYSRLQPRFEQLLSCPALTPAQVDMVELCVDAMAAQLCVTQAQADALAQTAEMTMSVPPAPSPPECDFLGQPLPGC